MVCSNYNDLLKDATSPSIVFLHFYIIGVTTRKYSRKRHLIIILSSPCGSAIFHINILILNPDFSVQFMTVNHVPTPDPTYPSQLLYQLK